MRDDREKDAPAFDRHPPQCQTIGKGVAEVEPVLAQLPTAVQL